MYSLADLKEYIYIFRRSLDWLWLNVWKWEWNISEHLLGSYEDTTEHQEGGGPLVEELEAPVVDRDWVDLQESTGDLGDCSHKFCHDSVLVLTDDSRLADNK